MYIVEKKHNYSAEANFNVAETLEEAAEYGRQFAEKYEFEIDDDSKLVDLDGNHDRFDNVLYHDTRDGEVGILSFMHAGGDGPCLRVTIADT